MYTVPQCSLRLFLTAPWPYLISVVQQILCACKEWKVGEVSGQRASPSHTRWSRSGLIIERKIQCEQPAKKKQHQNRLPNHNLVTGGSLLRRWGGLWKGQVVPEHKKRHKIICPKEGHTGTWKNNITVHFCDIQVAEHWCIPGVRCHLASCSGSKSSWGLACCNPQAARGTRSADHAGLALVPIRDADTTSNYIVDQRLSLALRCSWSSNCFYCPRTVASKAPAWDIQSESPHLLPLLKLSEEAIAWHLQSHCHWEIERADGRQTAEMSDKDKKQDWLKETDRQTDRQNGWLPCFFMFLHVSYIFLVSVKSKQESQETPRESRGPQPGPVSPVCGLAVHEVVFKKALYTPLGE